MLEQKDRAPVGGIMFAVTLSALAVAGGYLYAQKPKQPATEDKSITQPATEEKQSFGEWTREQKGIENTQNTEQKTSTLDAIHKQAIQEKCAKIFRERFSEMIGVDISYSEARDIVYGDSEASVARLDAIVQKIGRQLTTQEATEVIEARFDYASYVEQNMPTNESTENKALTYASQMAQERRKFIDAKWGPDAYGGSDWGKTTEENLTPIPKPAPYYNGQVLNEPHSACCCPLSVEVKGDDAYYIYLKALHTSLDTMEFMIKPGSSVELDVPVGRYEIYYATGKTWYGVDQKFGPETAYYKCDGTFQFTETSGWALELYEQVGGNLDTDKISANDFP